MPDFIEAYYPFGLGHISFGIIAANFFRYKGKIMLAVCSWKKPWHRSCRNQGGNYVISKPVTDWLRFFLPWPFLINGRICSWSWKASFPEPSLSWLPECDPAAQQKPLPGLCSLIPSSAPQTLGLRAGRAEGWEKSSQVNLGVSADNRSL